MDRLENDLDRAASACLADDEEPQTVLVAVIPTCTLVVVECLANLVGGNSVLALELRRDGWADHQRCEVEPPLHPAQIAST